MNNSNCPKYEMHKLQPYGKFINSCYSLRVQSTSDRDLCLFVLVIDSGICEELF